MRASRFIPWLVLLAAVGAFLAVDRRHEESGAAQATTVTRVVDGDTVEVRLDGRLEKVRLIGIDTPESVKPGTPVQCYAKAASAETERLLDGRRVELKSTPSGATATAACSPTCTATACSSTPRSWSAATRAP